LPDLGLRGERTDQLDRSWLIVRDPRCDRCREGLAPKPNAATLDQERIVLVASGPYHDKYILGPVLIDGRDVAQAMAVRTSTFSGTRGWQVEFRLTPEGAKKFAIATTSAGHAQPPGNQIAIIVDGRVVSAPIIQAPIRNGNGVITGNYDEQRAKALAAQLESAA
jgi:preprotein translocase subunit SecD